MSGGSVDGSGLIQVREECRLQPVSLALADIDHGLLINVNNFEIADGVFISTEIDGLLPPVTAGGWSSTTTGGTTTFKISSKREFDITINSRGNAANEPVDILTPGFTFNLGPSGVQVTATRFHNDNDFNNPFSFTWTGVTEVIYRVISAGGFNSVSAITAFDTVRPKTVRCYADAEEPNTVGLVLVGEKGSFEEFDEATVQGWDLCEQKEPSCFFPNGDPEPVVDGGGTLLDGETSYTINNISNGNIIYSSTTPGDVRTETGDVIEITATCPVNVFLRPTVNAAPILNPLVWSRGVTALPNYVFSGPFSFASTDGEPIEYSPGAFDAQLSLVEDATQPQGGQNFNLGLGHSAFATLLNANAPRASQDWGVVTMKAGQTFRIGGRDADAYNITIQPLIEREICEVVKENIDRIGVLENQPQANTDSTVVVHSGASFVSTNNITVNDGDQYIQFDSGDTWAFPAGGVSPDYIVSDEQCYIERKPAVTAIPQSFYDNRIATTGQTLTPEGSHIGFIGQQFRVDLSDFTQPLVDDQINNDWFLTQVVFDRPGAPFNASTNFILRLYDESGTLKGSSNPASLANSGPTIFNFAQTLLLKPEEGDYFQFAGGANFQGQLASVPDLDDRWTVWGDDPTNLSFGPFQGSAEALDAGDALPMSFEFNQIPIVKHEVRVLTDVSGNNNPDITLIDGVEGTVPPTWTTCTGLESAGLVPADIKAAQNLSVGKTCFEELVPGDLLVDQTGAPTATNNVFVDIINGAGTLTQVDLLEWTADQDGGIGTFNLLVSQLQSNNAGGGASFYFENVTTGDTGFTSGNWGLSGALFGAGTVIWSLPILDTLGGVATPLEVNEGDLIRVRLSVNNGNNWAIHSTAASAPSDAVWSNGLPDVPAIGFSGNVIEDRGTYNKVICQADGTITYYDSDGLLVDTSAWMPTDCGEGSTVEPATASITTTNGVKVQIGDLIQSNPDGTTYGTPSIAEYNEFINNFGPQYLALSYEAAGGANVTINVNGVDATYTDLLNALDVGAGRVNFGGGTNGNFNRRARVGAEVLKNVGDYVEIRLVNVAPFSQIIIALTQDTADLAHTTPGVYNFRATAGSNGLVESYSFRDKTNSAVASGSETDAVYRITRTLAGVSFRRDGVELYCTAVDEFVDYQNQPRNEINLISPDGTVWAVSVDNSGGIVTTEVL